MAALSCTFEAAPDVPDHPVKTKVTMIAKLALVLATELLFMWI